MFTGGGQLVHIRRLQGTAAQQPPSPLELPAWVGAAVLLVHIKSPVQTRSRREEAAATCSKPPLHQGKSPHPTHMSYLSWSQYPFLHPENNAFVLLRLLPVPPSFSIPPSICLVLSVTSRPCQAMRERGRDRPGHFSTQVLNTRVRAGFAGDSSQNLISSVKPVYVPVPTNPPHYITKQSPDVSRVFVEKVLKKLQMTLLYINGS
ncbi:unnamed protein product [Pleuronectes platessa]|uniref:Uncharacterized protein n=1 Tax=Pleuronectes platessa TaxID=8262 RepID=A0A9N7YMA9_PLEPL|nr:unnamed protein product [Pleuronectes platessa]